jgi:hypothetical protein
LAFLRNGFFSFLVIPVYFGVGATELPTPALNTGINFFDDFVYFIIGNFADPEFTQSDVGSLLDAYSIPQKAEALCLLGFVIERSISGLPPFLFVH